MSDNRIGTTEGEGTPLDRFRGFAQRWWSFQYEQGNFEEELGELIEFDRIGTDSYDASIELYGVADDDRLSPAAQTFLIDAGFGRAFVNHQNGWETHYTWGPLRETAKGWRVRYGHKNGEEGHTVEEFPDTWPVKWLESGYIKVVEAAKALFSGSPTQVEGEGSRDDLNPNLMEAKGG